MELEHVIATSGALRSATFTLPTDKVAAESPSAPPTAANRRFAYTCGSAIVVSDSNDQHSQALVRGHHNAISALTRSQSGRWVATGEIAPHADVCIWSRDSANTSENEVDGGLDLKFRLREHQSSIVSLSFSHDDSMLASLDASGMLIVVDLSNGGVITNNCVAGLFAKFGDHDPSQCSVLFGPRAQDIKRRVTDDYHVCFFGPGKIYLMKLNPFAPSLAGPIRTNLPTSQQSRIASAAYTLTGDLLVAGTEAGEVIVLHIDTGTVVSAAQQIAKLGIRQVVVLARQSTQYAAEQQLFGSDAGFRYARFGPGSQRRTHFVVASGDGSLVHCAIDDHTEPKVRVVSRAAVPSGIVALSATQDESSFVVTLSNGQMWTVEMAAASANNSNSNQDERQLAPRSARLVSDACLAPIQHLSAHPADPTSVVACTGDGAVTRWDLNSYLVTKTFDPNLRIGASAGQPVCTCAQIIAGLDIQVSGWSDSCVRCHDFASGELLWSVAKTHRGAVCSILVAPSLRFFLTGGEDGDIKVWDMRSRELKYVLSDHKQSVIMLHLLNTETHLISTSRDRTTVSWDMNRQRRITCHESFAGTTAAAAVAKDECRVLVSGAGGTFDEWDLRQKERARQASYALFSSYGGGAGSINNGGSRPFGQVPPPPTAASPMPVTPYATCLRRAPMQVGGERYFATGGSDHVVQIWDDRELRPVQQGTAHSAPVADIVYTCDGRQLVSGAADKAIMVWNLYDEQRLQ